MYIKKNYVYTTEPKNYLKMCYNLFIIIYYFIGTSYLPLKSMI